MERDEALVLLKAGRIEEWNRRREGGEVVPSLAYALLHEIDLRGVNLRGADLVNANLVQADLRGADLRGAQLQEAFLPRADLRQTDLRETFLRRANLQGARLSGVKLSKVVLRPADLRSADLSCVTLTHCDLRRADLREANLEQAELRGGRLRGANFSKATLDKAKLVRAKLISANLSEATLTGADLSYADLREANLADAVLMGTNLSKANLGKARLSGATLFYANLSGADSHEAWFFRARLSGANLTETNLNGADLGEANLSETNLRKANLTMANLTLARIIRCQIADACFENADITDCHVQETQGRPIPPNILRIKDDRTLSGEEARNFFNPPATVEVYLSTVLSDQEIGLYHFHLGDTKHGEIGTDVHLVGRRTEAEGTVLRFQAPTYEQIYRVLPDLLAPFRLSLAIDWAKTIENLPGNKRGEMLTELARIEGAAPAGFWHFAERLAAGIGNFPKAKVLRFGDGRDWAVRIDVFTKNAMMAKLRATERRAPPPQQRNEFNFSGNVHLSLEDRSMTQEFKAGGHIVAPSGSDYTVTTGDLVFQQVWNQSADSINLTSLADELGKLRAAMKQEGTDPEHDIATGNVALAEKSAKEGDGPKALQHLKSAGKWALDTATKIGVDVAAKALTKAIGVYKP
jgi:uncharacterized protein YjbI with pentapeptide repeats